MTTVSAPNGDEDTIKVVVYSEGATFVAQCLEYDISAYGPEIDSAIEFLELAIDSDFDECEQRGKKPCDVIAPAQIYFHKLWEKQTLKIEKAYVSPHGRKLEFVYSKAA